LAVPSLTTARLVLRQIVATDAASLHEALADAKVMTWWSSAPHRTLAESEAYVAKNSQEANGWRCWAITRDANEAIGWAILMEKREGVQEIGYILRRDHWGQGIAREAVSAVIAYAFATLGQRRIFADTDPDNVGSISLLESLGFRKEGHFRAEWKTHIGIRDSLIFGLLDGELRHT
jgi:[ribosomal protein S5]-alanine N-acetyltransferase